MMIGEFHRSHPTIQILQQHWDDRYDFFSNPTLHHHPYSSEHLFPSSPPAAIAFHRHLSPSPPSSYSYSPDPSYDTFPSDDFRMYEFKVRRCPRLRSHDWTDCPFVHPGEKARRRDPRIFRYSSSPCLDFRSSAGSCPAGDSCPLAHGVFESWLHPSRYRTQPCKDAVRCSRPVCFFAHTIDQLRLVVPEDAKIISPGPGPEAFAAAADSTTPVSRTRMRSYSVGGGVDSVSELVRAMKALRMRRGGGCVGNVAVIPSRRLELQSTPTTTSGCSPRSGFASPSTPAAWSAVVPVCSGFSDAWSGSSSSLSYEAAAAAAEWVESGKMKMALI